MCSQVVPKGRWVHAAMRWDASSQLVEMYLDGQLVHQSPVWAPCITYGAHNYRAIMIGAGGGGGHHFSGQLKDVAVYNTALSSSAIAALAHSAVQEGLPDPASGPPVKKRRVIRKAQGLGVNIAASASGNVVAWTERVDDAVPSDGLLRPFGPGAADPEPRQSIGAVRGGPTADASALTGAAVGRGTATWTTVGNRAATGAAFPGRRAVNGAATGTAAAKTATGAAGGKGAATGGVAAKGAVMGWAGRAGGKDAGNPGARCIEEGPTADGGAMAEMQQRVAMLEQVVMALSHGASPQSEADQSPRYEPSSPDIRCGAEEWEQAAHVKEEECEECVHEITQTWRFCPGCGTSLPGRAVRVKTERSS